MSAATLVLPPTPTPPSYHRIVSPTLQIPSDPQKPIPVGLLACQRDPLLRELVSTVVSCVHSQTQPDTSTSKKSKKDKTQASEPLLEVILHDTILFPEGGGQPSDIGQLTTSDGEIWSVVEVKRHGGHAVHYVQVKAQAVEPAIRAFATGSTVGIALGTDGFKRRLDHMSMHTSQHLLSALLETRLNLPTLSWSLTSYPTPSYVEIPRAMTADEIATIQNEANTLVFEGRKVHVEVEELDTASRSDVAKLESGRTVGKALPADYTGGVKRTVVIDGVDRNPCCGTHLPSLHNLQLFLLPQTDSVSRSSTTTARLYFLSGPRLITHLTSTHTFLANTAGILSCGAPQVPARAEQVIDERKRAVKRVEDVERELAGALAKELLTEAERAGETGLVVHKHRVDDTVNALGFLSSVSMSFASQLASKPGPLEHLVVLSSSPSSQSASSTTVVLIFGSDEKVKVVGDLLKSKLNVKGGGKGTRWSGKFTGVWKDGREGAGVEEILRST